MTTKIEFLETKVKEHEGKATRQASSIGTFGAVATLLAYASFRLGMDQNYIESAVSGAAATIFTGGSIYGVIAARHESTAANLYRQAMLTPELIDEMVAKAETEVVTTAETPQPVVDDQDMTHFGVENSLQG